MNFSWKEFRPTILFLFRFIGLYFVANLLYGLYVTSYEPYPDPVTKSVTRQTAWVIGIFSQQPLVVDHQAKPTTTLLSDNKSVVSVYEGCNGVNIVIMFLAFLFSFGPYRRALLWYALGGVFIIHLFNIGRIAGLYSITLYTPALTYFVHKYIFTVFIYLVVVALWLSWIQKFANQKHKQ
jgi:exosortase family protein XrtF